MRYLGRLSVYALVFMLSSVLFSIEVLPLYENIAFSFLASALLTSIMAEVVGIVILLPLVAIYYFLFGKTGLSFATGVSLGVCYTVQFGLIQYFGEKFAWYPNFSNGETLLFLVVNFVLALALTANGNKN